jgi:prophage tail gpP-like protein
VQSAAVQKALWARAASLRVGGLDYGGWQSIRVTRGIESLSGSFELAVSDRWPGHPEKWPIAVEDVCQVLLGTVPVITGYIDRRSVSYSAQEHTVSIAGRDKAAALVDCSAAVTKWEYRGVDLLSFARALAKPFGVSVAAQPGLRPIVGTKLSIEPGESVWEVLEHACRFAGCLAVSDGQGGILLTRAGTETCATALVEGQNILSASAQYDGAGRFRTYVVTGQHAGSDDFMGDSSAMVRGAAKDAGVRRAERVLLVRSENGITPALAGQRAQWEAIVRAARAETFSARVQGWAQGDGSLWPVNALVRLTSPMLGVDADVLITQATYSLDEQNGSTTELSLKRKDAFSPEPVVPKASYWSELAGGVK